MVRPQAAALPLASKVGLLALFTAAIGRKAAFTALKAFTMPVPHSPEDGQEHSLVVASVLGHTGRLLVLAGKAVALDSRRATNCAGVRLPLTERISAAI